MIAFVGAGKFGVLAVNTLAAIALAACQNSVTDGENPGLTTGSSSPSISSSNGDNVNTDTDVDTGESSLKDRRDIMHNTNAFFSSFYKFPEGYGEKLKIVEGAVQSGNVDPNNYPRVAALLFPLIEDFSGFSNYKELNDESKAQFSQVAVENRTVYSIVGQSYESARPEINEGSLKVNGNSATIDVTMVFKFKEDAKIDGMEEVRGDTMNVSLVKTSDGWKVDSSWYVSAFKDSI